jgi:wobble nucleotide-excising tRNase
VLALEQRDDRHRLLKQLYNEEKISMTTIITKIKSIDNFAVFNGFQWDCSVVGTNEKPLSFDKINILHGRNYSGKTTLSRIIRAFEIHRLPEKYENPQFEVIANDDRTITQYSLDAHSLDIRVFNEDFVRQHLNFLIDPDSEIAPFAILGANNAEIERAINELEHKLGSDEVGQESGLYILLAEAATKAKKAATDYNKVFKDLEDKLGDKATGKQRGIKYNFTRFGDQNYTIIKLRGDIQTVLSSSYTLLSDVDKTVLESTIREQQKTRVSVIQCPQLSFSEFCQQAENFLCQKISTSQKNSGTVARRSLK